MTRPRHCLKRVRPKGGWYHSGFFLGYAEFLQAYSPGSANQLHAPTAQTTPSHPDLIIDSWSTQKSYVRKFFWCSQLPSLWPKFNFGYFWPMTAHQFVWFLCQSIDIELANKMVWKWTPKSTSVSQKVPQKFSDQKNRNVENTLLNTMTSHRAFCKVVPVSQHHYQKKGEI